MNVVLYVPKLEDYWYEKYLDSDPDTMSYNKGYDVSYNGYDYETGCIDFKEEKWVQKYQRRIKGNRYFAYVFDKDINTYVGSVNYQFDSSNNRYECGVVIEGKYRRNGYAKIALDLLCKEAKRNGVDVIYDVFEDDRISAKNLFLNYGFIIDSEISITKFKKEVKGIVVKKYL